MATPPIVKPAGGSVTNLRDVDVLFVGSLHPVIDHDRLPWLRNAARLSENWKVAVHPSDDPASSRPLLNRAKVAVCVGRWGRIRELATKAVNAGALLISDASSGEIVDDFSVIRCRQEELESVVERFLRDENARTSQVHRLQSRQAELMNQSGWESLIHAIDESLPKALHRSDERKASARTPPFSERLWHLLADGNAAEPTLVRDLAEWSAKHPYDADAHNSLGVAIAATACADRPLTADITQSVQQHFQLAVDANPAHLVARLNLVEVLVALGEKNAAIESARATLREAYCLDGVDVAQLSAVHYPPSMDWFRLGWEQAALHHAGDEIGESRAKLRLIRWQLNLLLAELTGELPHFYETEMAWPGVPGCAAALGCRLGRDGRPQEAVIHLQRAVNADPLDSAAARALFHCFGELGRHAARRRLQRDANALNILGLMADENWIQESLQEPGQPANEDAITRTPILVGASPVKLVAPTPGLVRGVSLCMIVKNEEANIGACLESVRDLMDEIIVVDTGSTDATKAIASNHGAKVFDFPWVDSFAAARNESLRHATREWVFWLDADDRVNDENRHRLKTLISQLSAGDAAFVMKCLCLPDHESGTATVVDHIRLFRNDPRIRWKYRVHEQILVAVRATGGEVLRSDVVVHHIGYQDPRNRPPKLQRDLRLLQLEDMEHPNEPFTLFNLGWTYTELGQPAEALTYLSRSLAHSSPGDSIVRKIYVLMAQSQWRLGRSNDALHVCREGLRNCPNDVELLFEEASLLASQENLAAAEACLIHLLNMRDETYFTSVDPALRGYRAHHQLGNIYRRQRRNTEARTEWERALAQRDDYLPAMLELLEITLDEKDWPEFETLMARLESNSNFHLAADVLRARSFVVQQDFQRARDLLERTKQRFPDALWPRVVLSNVLLQEHRDLDAAERALRDVLAIDPEHAQSRHNLRVLLRDKMGITS